MYDDETVDYVKAKNFILSIQIREDVYNRDVL